MQLKIPIENLQAFLHPLTLTSTVNVKGALCLEIKKKKALFIIITKPPCLKIGEQEITKRNKPQPCFGKLFLTQQVTQFG